MPKKTTSPKETQPTARPKTTDATEPLVEVSTILGIDNGSGSGGIAALSINGGSPFSMAKLPSLIYTRPGKPTSKCKSARKDKNFTELDVIKFQEMVLAIDRPDKIIVVLEDCPDHANQASIMRSMAFCAGSIIATLRLAGIPTDRIIRVLPRDWQPEMLGKCKQGETKAAALRVARSIWPDESFILQRCREPSTAVIDASLIAQYYLNQNQ